MNTVQPRGVVRRAFFSGGGTQGKTGEREGKESVRTVVGGEERRRWAFLMGIRASEYQGRYVCRYG